MNPKVAGGVDRRRRRTADYTKLRGGAGTGIRPPDGFELAFTDNPSLKPERSRSFEAGVEQAFAGGHAVVEATAFSNRYDDLIVAVGSFAGSSRYRTDNISNARARGLELALTVRGRVLRWRRLDLAGRVGYTCSTPRSSRWIRTMTAPPPFTVGQPLLRRPRHQFSADASVAAGSGRPASCAAAAAARRSTSSRRFGTFGGLFDAPGYSVWNAGASCERLGSLDVFGRVENLFDRDYEEAFGFPALGRRFTAGLRIAAGR